METKKILFDLYFNLYPKYLDFDVTSRVIFLSSENDFFQNWLYPFLEQLNETQLRDIAEELKPEQKETLAILPESLLSLKEIEVITIAGEYDQSESILTFNCFEKVVKSYKHPALFELLSLIGIDKVHAIKKENHNNLGYHFHLYEKEKRTATLLTFDSDEQPNRRSQADYFAFKHSLYYEPHSEGSTTKAFQNLNTKNSKFKSTLYSTCKTIVLKMDKVDFKKQGNKATKLIL